MSRQKAEWTDQQRHVVTEEVMFGPWGGGAPGEFFRCHLCGFRFLLGDVYRWVRVRGAADGFQIWCNRHDINVAKFTIEAVERER